MAYQLTVHNNYGIFIKKIVYCYNFIFIWKLTTAYVRMVCVSIWYSSSVLNQQGKKEIRNFEKKTIAKHSSIAGVEPVTERVYLLYCSDQQPYKTKSTVTSASLSITHCFIAFSFKSQTSIKLEKTFIHTPTELLVPSVAWTRLVI